ncbi:hypothetical protein VP01_3686g1 [Puccinia sorghi]|uniref:Tc1-like transposase DDE domain-containing protein n=1 Tax=Puccinia sorghi TaxID=27349 RepID=A0A0L6UW73_9BASI|nr:hypothetical protein VP01_3686g1 [Puccinia sorghi]
MTQNPEESRKNTKRKVPLKTDQVFNINLTNQSMQVDVAKTFGISDQQLTTDIIPLVLLPEETPSTILKKIAEHVKNKFNIQVSPGAIQKTLKNMEVTWKTVTPIPHKFNSDTHPYQGYSLSDGKKKTGMTSIDICNFLVCLQNHCPAQSIIIIDNTRIHGGDDFERVKNLLKESTRKINIKVLPKYLLLLNTIELAFNIIKTQIKHK